MNHTREQIEDWHSYEYVRKRGYFNMFDPRAREMTGLSKEQYMYCLKNYTSLKEQAEQHEPPAGS